MHFTLSGDELITKMPDDGFSAWKHYRYRREKPCRKLAHYQRKQGK